jgi:hypothetical protein
MTRKLTALVTLVTLTLGLAAIASAAPPEKVVICHAAGLEDVPANWVTLELPLEALNGHFDEQGTPQAGHEEDYFGTCEEAEETTTTTVPEETTTTTVPETTTTTVVHEDTPEWDCATMGNGICGPIPYDEIPPPAEPIAPNELNPPPPVETERPSVLPYTGFNTQALGIVALILLSTGAGLVISTITNKEN